MAEKYLRLPNATAGTPTTANKFGSWGDAYAHYLTSGYPTLDVVIADVPVKITGLDTIFPSKDSTFSIQNAALLYHPHVVFDGLAAREKGGDLDPKVASVIMQEAVRADDDPTKKRRG